MLHAVAVSTAEPKDRAELVAYFDASAHSLQNV